MGLIRIDESPKPLTPEEWNRREMRKHAIQRWAITLAEIAFMVAAVWGMLWLLGEVGP